MSLCLIDINNNEEEYVLTTKENQDNTLFIVLISIVATIGGFLFGFDSGVINGTIDGLKSAFDSDSVATGFNVIL